MYALLLLILPSKLSMSLFVSIKQQMNEQHSLVPTLIYFKTRGNAHLIRCVLLEIGVEFQQIFVQFNGHLDQKKLNIHKVDIKCLPLLIHKGFQIKGIFPIIKYCCTSFKRTDLLGKNLKDQVMINQIMQKQLKYKGIILHVLFKGLKQIYDNNLGKQGLKLLTKKLGQVVETAKIIQPIKQLFKKSNQFLLGYLTVIDFNFADKAFYALNFLPNEAPQLYIAESYMKMFEASDFYKKNEKKLSQYKIFFPEIDCQLNQVLKQMWKGDPKYLDCD